MAAAENSSYVFSQQPAAVQDRKKFREPILDFSRTNIMADPRVVRGNTYAALVRPESQESDELSRGAAAMSRRFRERGNKGNTHGHGDQHFQHQDEIGSHEFLEELTGPIISHIAVDPDDVEQGDEDHVPFVPKPAGHNKGTFIEDTDLFDFELSVEPLLEVLIGKGMEQGMLEILSEEETKVLEDRRSRWEQQRDAVHVEAQILLAEKQRQVEELKRRVDQASDKAMNDKVEQRKWAARDISKSYMDNCRDSVLSRLKDVGHFYDPVVNQINTAFMPWLLENVSQHLVENSESRKSVEKLLHKALETLVAEQQEKAAREEAVRKAEEERIRQEEEEKQKREADRKFEEEAEKLNREAALAKALTDEGDEGDEGGGDEDEDEE